MKNIFFLLTFAALAGNLGAQDNYEGIVFMENEPWEKVLHAAKEQNRLIFMDCYTTWCGPCKGLSDNIFPQKKVGDFFNANFVNAKYDMEKGDGEMLSEKYKENIIGFPTMLLIDADGNVVHQMAGYHEADQLIAGMKAGLEGNSLFAVEERYIAGNRDMETIKAYVAALEGAFKRDRITEVLTEFMQSIPTEKLLEPEVWDLVGKQVKDPYTKEYRFVFDNIERGYQYKLKVDRYALESQLANGMSRAVDDIINTSRQTKDADTLRMMREKTFYLKEMLGQNTIKRFTDYMAKLSLNDLRLAANPDEMFRNTGVYRDVGMFRYDTYFLRDCYRYIIENTDDAGIVRQALDKVIELQGPEKENRAKLSSNLYDVIAVGYARLGEEAKAQDAQNKYDKLKAESEAYFREFLGGKDN